MNELLSGLCRALPADESAEWSPKDRRKWFLAAIAVFDLLYKRDDDGRSITVTIDPVEAAP
jgi:hypothetical protein